MSVQEEALYAKAEEFRKKFEDAMEDDCNTADAVSAVFELVKFINTNSSAQNARAYLQKLYDLLQTLCVIQERQEARKQKDFARADQIRDELAQKGILLKDTREGVTWKRA